MTESDKRYSCEAQQRILALIDRLTGYEVFGISTKDLAQRMDASQATIYRDMVNLQLSGWAEQLDDGRWRLCVNAARKLRRINDGINAALAKVNEARRDYQEV